MNTPFEKKVCYTLCVCELTFVLSCVSIFYLTFAIYLPSYRQLNAGFSEQTVMCTTLSNITIENCEVPESPGSKSMVQTWYSCGEWCLSKSQGTCTQIRVDVRKNGTNVILEECDSEMEDVIYCDGVDPKQETKECITGGCSDITGLYNCTMLPVSDGVTETTHGAYCRDVTLVLGCNLTSTDPAVHCKNKKACVHLNGLYLCRKGHCARVRPPFKCERKCTGIQTGGKNIIIRENDVIFSAHCKRAVDMETNEEIWPRDLIGSVNGSDVAEPPLLVMYCTSILNRQMNLSEIHLMDCFNGTLMEPGYFGEITDIIRLVEAHTENERWLDPTKEVAPPEKDLVLLPNAPLYINYEGCVNTLILRECEKFYAHYGVDGSDLRTSKRFPCFYRPNFTADPDAGDAIDQNYVILRLDMEKTHTELVYSAVVPVILAIISCIVLVVCSKIIHVDNESHFYVKAFNKVYKPPIPPPDPKVKI
ncbi:unnamed protein product [Allacma fusca]|uniref:Uncharacterized protein n=1 Tax=Allacma fusca TaxID=39272 RepID=A0A8J2PIY2_9HEXA|nr:unnamed protein product [Allacma fusca]